MNYPQNNYEYNLMCYIWFRRVLHHGAKEIMVFYMDNYPRVAEHFQKRQKVEVRIIKRNPVIGYGNHFNIRIKLPTLGSIKRDFIFLDSDMYVLADLQPLWGIRKIKPWIGVNHQWLKNWPDTHRAPFLNSGLQVVGNPSFYDWKAMCELHKEAKKVFITPGRDQSIIQRWFRKINYDYTHPFVGTEWNSCAMVGKLWLENKKWRGHTKGLRKDHPVYINHYWSTLKPWAIKCPLHASYKQEFEREFLKK
jgi:hypothetical protein